MSRPPFQVRIVGKDYPVLVRDPKEDTYLDGLHGYCDHRREQIVLTNIDRQHQQRETLWHELFHACEKATNTYLKEEEVSRIARAQYAVLVDNPLLVQYLTGE